jgi:chaperone BCS1
MPLPPGLFDKITSHLLSGNNQFASGGLLLMAIGGVIAAMKSIPRKIYNWFLLQLTIQLTITDEQEAFYWFKWWFQNQEYSERFRNMDAFTPYTQNGYELMLAPAPGRHWFFRNKRPLYIHLNRSEDKKTDGGFSSARRTESYVIWTYGRDQKYMSTLLKEIRSDYDKAHSAKPKLLIWAGDDEWTTSPAYSPRTLDSVILPDGHKTALLHDIDQYKKSKEWYQKMGIPFHRGYLFYGPPGTGKTSLVTGLSSHYNCRVYILKLGDMLDSTLMTAIAGVKPDSMVVLEDVDCAVLKRSITDAGKPKIKEEKDKDKEKGEEKLLGVSLSGLLNALDGMQTPSGVMFFMTTNHVEKLDHALLRPGRTDVKMYIGPATEAQKHDLYKRFFPEDDVISSAQFVQQFPAATSMAEFQELLMQERNRRAGTTNIGETGVKSAAAE